MLCDVYLRFVLLSTYVDKSQEIIYFIWFNTAQSQQPYMAMDLSCGQNWVKFFNESAVCMVCKVLNSH